MLVGAGFLLFAKGASKSFFPKTQVRFEPPPDEEDAWTRKEKSEGALYMVFGVVSMILGIVLFH